MSGEHLFLWFRAVSGWCVLGIVCYWARFGCNGSDLFVKGVCLGLFLKCFGDLWLGGCPIPYMNCSRPLPLVGTRDGRG